MLTLVANQVSFPSVAVTPNQKASSAAIQALGTGSLYSAVLVSSTANALVAFDAASGEIHATVLASQFQAATASRRNVLDHMRRARHDEGWVVWGSMSSDWGNIKGDGNAAAANSTGFEFNAGADTALDDHWRAGVECGYDTGALNVSARSSHASLAQGHVGVYAFGNYDNYVLRTGFSYGIGTAKTLRTISFTGFSDTARASQDAQTMQLYGEVGYDFALQHVTLEPFAGLDWTKVKMGAFREMGGAAALAGAERGMSNGYLSMGVQATPEQLDLGGATLAPVVRMTWQHGFDALTPSRSVGLIAGGPAFTVLGTTLENDRALLDVGATMSLDEGVNISLGYHGAFGSRSKNNAVQAELNWAL